MERKVIGREELDEVMGKDEALEGEVALERYSLDWVSNIIAILNDSGPAAKTVIAAAVSNIYISEPEDKQEDPDHVVQAVRVVWRPEMQELLAKEREIRNEALDRMEKEIADA